MLPFSCAFLILLLSSSVIAAPAPSSINGVSKLLLDPHYDKETKQLLGRPWARVRPVISGTEHPEDIKWTDNAQFLDDFIRFTPGTGPQQEQVELHRIDRRLVENKQYCVFRPQAGRPATTSHLLGPLHIGEGSSYLNNTYWAQIPDILGRGQGYNSKVSDGLKFGNLDCMPHYAL